VNCTEIPAPAMTMQQSASTADDSGEIRVGKEETLDDDEDDDEEEYTRTKTRKTNRWGSLGAKLRGHFEKLIDPTDDTDLDEDE
ncbi:MAG: hypothetical protein K2L49_04780, partial [Muribaculaceae bacterium]|nr:hypothetical protein [Muribaculaceae bacterium]